MVFFFSATGNSKYVAKKLSDEFCSNMVDIREAISQQKFEYMVEDGEKVIFVFPIYYYGLPEIVSRFIKRVTILGNDFEVCGISTCGGSPGGTDKRFSDLCLKKGWDVKAFFDVKMIDNYVMLFKIPLLEEQIMVLRRSDEKIKDVIDSIKFNYRVSYNSNIAQRMLSKIAQGLFKKMCRTKKFKVRKTCTACGLCEDICPLNAIKIVNNIPVWTKKKCMHCTGCINRCPVSAIEYGKATVKRGRFVNPNIEM